MLLARREPSRIDFSTSDILNEIRKKLAAWSGNWSGTDEDITQLEAVRIKQYYRAFAAENEVDMQTLIDLAIKYFPLQGEMDDDENFSAEKLAKDHRHLLKSLNAIPELRRPYQEVFTEHVFNYFTQIKKLLAALVKKIKEKTEDPSIITCHNFLDFAYAFTNLPKPETPNIKDNEVILEAFTILDDCFKLNNELFLQLLAYANLLRAHSNGNQTFLYSKTKLQKDNKKSLKINDFASKYTNAEILTAQFNHIITLILGNYFISPIKEELQQAFPNPKDCEPMINNYSKELKFFKSKASQNDSLKESIYDLPLLAYIIPPTNKFGSSIAVYENYYKKNAWNLLKKDTDELANQNIILNTVKNTWINLINKIPAPIAKQNSTFVPNKQFQDIKESLIKSAEFNQVAQIDLSITKKIQKAKDLTELSLVIKPPTLKPKSNPSVNMSLFALKTEALNKLDQKFTELIKNKTVLADNENAAFSNKY